MDYFKTELSYIKDKRIRDNATLLVSMLPEYFFKVAASSTGKYHPTFSLGDGGLYRHTKAAVRIAYELLNLEMYKDVYNEHERDLIIMSIMLHDGLKHGLEKSEYTLFEHPVIMGDFILNNRDKLTLSDDEINFVVNAIKSHMGEWNKDRDGNEVLPKPNTKAGKFVHMCDFLSSRKFFDVKFDDNNEITNAS